MTASETIFRDYAERIVERRAKEGIRGISRERSRLRQHLLRAPFADLSIETIRAKDIRGWLAWMSDKKAADRRGDRKLSRHTIHRSQSLLSAVFSVAVEEELIDVNPCAGVRLKKRVDERDTKEPWCWLTPEEQRALTSCEKLPAFDRLQIRFAIATGLRQGEHLNLEVKDLHVDRDPHVCVRFGSKGKAPKSGKMRRVPLFGDGLAAAREILAMLSTMPNHEGLVFPSLTGRRRHAGKPLGKSSAFRGYLRAAGIQRNVRWHDLRHTCASNLVSGALGRRWTLEEIQPLMGHSSITITQRYAHIGEDALKAAARETSEALAQRVPTEPVTMIAPVAPVANDVEPTGWRGLMSRALRRLTLKEADRVA